VYFRTRSVDAKSSSPSVMVTPRNLVLAVFALAVFATILWTAFSPLVKASLFQRHSASGPSADSRSARIPTIVLWSWERPDDLSSVDPRDTAVAFLAGTIFIKPRAQKSSATPAVVRRPRLQPLRIPHKTNLMAVVRIESSGGAALDSQSQKETVNSILSLSDWPGVQSLQIDFDALKSEQEFYKSLLIELRQRLPQETPLSVTALVSWCTSDPWLDELPAGVVDEAVPMLFRMGQGSANLAHDLTSSRDFTVEICRGSLGIATDEPFSQAILTGEFAKKAGWKNRRIYVFHPAAWNPQSARNTVSELNRWHDASSAWR
jgi:hypothetical protein